jgi:hypothetical protein
VFCPCTDKGCRIGSDRVETGVTVKHLFVLTFCANFCLVGRNCLGFSSSIEFTSYSNRARNTKSGTRIDTGVSMMWLKQQAPWLLCPWACVLAGPISRMAYNFIRENNRKRNDLKLDSCLK